MKNMMPKQFGYLMELLHPLFIDINFKPHHFLIHINQIIITHKQMIFYIIILIILAVIGYRYIWKPWKLYQFYAESFKKQGYRVYEVPFKPYAITFFDIYDVSEQAKDAHKIPKERYKDYDVVIMNLFNKLYIELLHPDLVREFFSAEKVKYQTKTEFEKGTTGRILGDGLVYSEGNVWKMKKKVLTEVFSFDFLKSESTKIASLSEKVLNKMQEECQGRELEYDVHRYTSELAGNVMFECFFGKTCTEQKIEGMSVFQFVLILMGNLFQQTFNLGYILFGTRFIEAGLTKNDKSINDRLKIYRAWGKNILEERSREIKKKMEEGELSDEPADLIQAIVRNSLKEKKEGEIAYTNQDIMDEFSTFIVAGVDTTSNYLAMTIYLIFQHPEVEKKLREQIKTYMKDDDYSYENMKNFTYIDCIQKQTTRHFGPVNGNFTRIVVQDHHLREVLIKKGVYLNVQPVGTHYSQRYFKNPKEFRPERWISECDNIPNYAFNGFSGGPRTCIGKHLAKLVAKIGLIKFMKRYEKIELPQKEIEFVMKTAYQPKHFKSKLTRLND